MRNLAYINPRIITWALDRQNLEPEQIATATMTADKIRAWIREENHPTEAQAELLADKLKIPYLVLFLSAPPPPEKIPIPDLRTRTNKPVSDPSPEFVSVINDVLTRQDWFREQKERGGKKLSFVGKFTTDDSVVDVAASMRSVLGINNDFRQQCTSWAQFLRRLIVRVEASGILVMKSGVMGHSTRHSLDANEFQGFAVSDPYAPVVFINDTDARAAQIFTLAHELAHIWIGATGISNARLGGKTLSELGKIERFCNQVAAEFLVPERSFTIAWQSYRSVQANLQKIAKYFWVSSLVALRRAYDLKKIDYDHFKQAIDAQYAHYAALEEKRKKKEEEAKKKQTGDFWATFKLRNSTLFSDAVVASIRSANTTYSEASNLLGVSISTIEKFLRREKAAA
jgi:Zn-dependent peptidase ImmA (M78 family)